MATLTLEHLAAREYRTVMRRVRGGVSTPVDQLIGPFHAVQIRPHGLDDGDAPLMSVCGRPVIVAIPATWPPASRTDPRCWRCLDLQAGRR